MDAGVPDAVERAIARGRLWPAGSRLVVAVSGGADSVALLHALHACSGRQRLSLHVAHLDHALRPESPEDAAFVRALAGRWRLPVTIARWPVAERCEREGWSLEDGARRLRYQFLQEVAKAHSAGVIALAHTADDQAETVLMRLVRGTGLLGLSAIPAKRRLQEVWLVRPLLGVWRYQLLAYLDNAGLVYREDASNRDLSFLRNRVRHELLPLLERACNPNIKAALTQLAEQSADDYAYLQAAARRHWKRLAKPVPSGGPGRPPAIEIRVAGFLRQPTALQRQLLRQAILELRGELTAIEFRHWRGAQRLFAGRPAGTVLDLPGGIRLQRRTETVLCQLAVPGEPDRAEPAGVTRRKQGLRPPRQSEYTVGLRR